MLLQDHKDSCQHLVWPLAVVALQQTRCELYRPVIKVWKVQVLPVVIGRESCRFFNKWDLPCGASIRSECELAGGLAGLCARAAETGFGLVSSALSCNKRAKESQDAAGPALRFKRATILAEMQRYARLPPQLADGFVQ